MGDWKAYVPNYRVLLNHATNTSFETGTTNFSTGGTNTLAQSTTYAYAGIYSGKVTYSNSTTLLTTTFTHAGAEAEIYHCWVYVPSSYSGGDITIDITGSFVTATDVSGISSSIDVTDSANIDKWMHIGKKAVQLGGGKQLWTRGCNAERHNARVTAGFHDV